MPAAGSTTTPNPACNGVVTFDAVGPGSAGAGSPTGAVTSLSWSHTTMGPNGLLTVGVAVDAYQGVARFKVFL